MASAPGRVSAARLIKPETLATAPQNALATDGPSTVAAGTFGLESRVPSIHVNGLRQTVLVFGPAVESGLSLAPAARVAQPCERSTGAGHLGQQDRPGPQRHQRRGGVIATDARSVLSIAEVQSRAVEGRVRPSGGVDDRMRSAPPDLGIVPARVLPAAVLKHHDLGGCAHQRLGRRGGVERAASLPSRFRAGR